jgi:streptomycin 6-kinase
MRITPTHNHSRAYAPAVTEHLAAGEPFERPLDDAACAAAEALRLGGPAEAGVVVHRDVHLGDVLAAGREPWLVSDPNPLVGEAAFDRDQQLADALDRDADSERCEWASRLLAQRLGVDLDRPSDRALVRAVDFALSAYEVGDVEASGRLMLAPSLTAVAGR